MKIKAAVVEENGANYQMKEVNLKEPSKNDILVKIVATGICGTDHSIRQGSIVPTPNILGHEGAGIVEAVGDNVKNVKIGDHVVLSYAYCRNCEACEEGNPAACEHMPIYNYGGKNLEGESTIKDDSDEPIASFFNQSSFATYSLVDESNVVKVPKDIDLRILGPLSCGIATGSGAIFNVLKPEYDTSLVVFGAGAVGYASIMSAKISGCTKIIAVDINDTRLDMAKKLGATHIINSTKIEEDIVDVIKGLTDGKGVNYSIDTTGVPLVIKQSILSLKRGGTAAPLAIAKQPIELNTMRELANENRNIVGVLMGNNIPKYHIPKLISYYQDGRFPFDKLIEFYDFEDINQAEEDAMTGKVFKSVLVIDKTYQPPK